MAAGNLGGPYFCSQCGSRLLDNKTCPNMNCFRYRQKLSSRDGTPSRREPSHRRYQVVIAVLVALLIGAVAFDFLGAGSDSSVGFTRNATPTSHPSSLTKTAPTATSTLIPTPAPTVTPTATPMPSATPSSTPTSPPVVGTVLCLGGGSKGWSGWAGSSDWKILNGALLNDGSKRFGGGGAPSLVAPCQLGAISNYAVEVTMQIISAGNNPSFGIDIRGTTTQNGWQGYMGSMCQGIGCGYGYLLSIDADNSENMLTQTSSYDPGTTSHTYRVEVKDNNIRWLIDGAQILSVTDNQYLTGDEVGLWCNWFQLSVSSFKVVAL